MLWYDMWYWAIPWYTIPYIYISIYIYIYIMYLLIHNVLIYMYVCICVYMYTYIYIYIYILRYTVLCWDICTLLLHRCNILYVILCMLRYAMRCSIVDCTVLCHAMLHSTMLWCTNINSSTALVNSAPPLNRTFRTPLNRTRSMLVLCLLSYSI